MASSKEMVDYVCDQLSGAGEIRAKRMFGEWGLYCGGVYFGCVCDNQLFIKPTATNVDLLARPEPAAPYEGAELKQGGKKRNGQEEFPWTEKDC